MTGGLGFGTPSFFSHNSISDWVRVDGGVGKVESGRDKVVGWWGGGGGGVGWGGV